jgi:hypothetical protein
MPAARYWRISGMQTPSGSLNLGGMALSDGTADYAAATLTGTLAPGFKIDWDLGASVAIDRIKLTSVTAPDFPTSFFYEYSADAVTWVSGAIIEVVTYPGNAAVATVVFNDPYSQYVSLLLPMRGGFSDISGSPKTVTVFGNTQISSAQSKFGANSGYFDGAGDYLNITPASGIAVGTGDFTVEGWFFLVPDKTYPTAFEIGDRNSATGMSLIVSYSGNACIYSGGYYGSKAVTANVWTHIAWVRKNSVLTVYVNGVGSTPVTFSNDLSNSASVTVGSVAALASSEFYNGYINDLRFDRHFARYTANFTPPSAALMGVTTGITLPVVKGSRVDSGVAAIAADTPDAGPSLVGGSAAALDMFDGGTGQIVGTVAEKHLPTNTPLARRVTLIDESTRRTIREVWSSPAGGYTFSSIDAARKYTVLAYDHENDYRAVVADNLTPTPQ